MRLGLAVKRQAGIQPAAAQHILMLINDAEPGVSNAELDNLCGIWKSKRPDNVSVYHFEREMKLPHDIITPGTPGVPTEDVNARIITQVTRLAENKFLQTELG
jgi:hypothetical protein